MTDDEGLSAREAADWCGSGVTVREVTRLRQLADLDSRELFGRQAFHRRPMSCWGIACGPVSSANVFRACGSSGHLKPITH
jgi:hypothetical protein